MLRGCFIWGILAVLALPESASAQSISSMWKDYDYPYEVEFREDAAPGVDLYQPVSDEPLTVPTVVFFHGGSPFPNTKWGKPLYRHVAALGYNVVTFLYCDPDIYCTDIPAYADTATERALAGIAALDESQVRPARHPDGRPIWSAVAYSLGSMVAMHLASRPEGDLPAPESINLLEPGGFEADLDLILRWVWLKGLTEGRWVNTKKVTEQIEEYWISRGWDGERWMGANLPLDDSILSKVPGSTLLSVLVAEDNIDDYLTASLIWEGTSHLERRNALVVPTLRKGFRTYLSNHFSVPGGTLNAIDWYGYWTNTTSCLAEVHDRPFQGVCLGTGWSTFMGFWNDGSFAEPKRLAPFAE